MVWVSVSSLNVRRGDTHTHGGGMTNPLHRRWGTRVKADCRSLHTQTMCESCMSSTMHAHMRA